MSSRDPTIEGCRPLFDLQAYQRVDLVQIPFSNEYDIFVVSFVEFASEKRRHSASSFRMPSSFHRPKVHETHAQQRAASE